VQTAQVHWSHEGTRLAREVVLPPLRVMATDHATIAVGLLHNLERYMFGCPLTAFLKAIRGLFGIVIWVWVSDSASADKKMIRLMSQSMRQVR
jgi:hypothetical protein